jgi:PKD repeat protein
VAFGIILENTGDAIALNVTVEIYDGDNSTGTLIDTYFAQTVNAADNVQLLANDNWTATIGIHTINAYLDTSDNVAEDDETNNVITISLTVLGIPDARVEQGGLIFSNHAEGTITITADAINGGNAVASGYQMGFYLGDPSSGGSLIGRPSLADIPVGGRATAEQAWAASDGKQQIFVQVENTHIRDIASNNQVNRLIWITADLTARAGPDQSAFAGQDIIFNGSASSSSGGSIVNYTWDLGDGTTMYGAVVTHNYTNSGTTARVLTARLTVKDGSGGTDSDTCTVYINPQGSSPPTADAGTAPTGPTRQNLAFDGSSSTGNITTYTWDFGDGSGASGSGATERHIYMDDGVFTVSLAVMDNRSLADVDVITVTVTNRPPVVEPIDNIVTDVGVSHDLVVMSYDDDGHIVSYLWDFADGTTSSVRDPTHSWASDGNHQCSVNVTDDDGAYTVVNFWVNVTDVIPVADFTHDAVRNEGQAVRVDGSVTVEPGDDIVLWQWDWESDGTFDNTTGPASETVYTKPGYYNITLRVTDGEGTTNETTREVMVRNVAPTAALSIPDRTVDEGQNVTFDCSASDEPGGDIVRYYFDWDGDNSYDFNTTEPVVNHSYFTVGVFITQIIVLDEDGSYDHYSHFWWSRVTVSNAPPLVNASESSGPEGENITITVDAFEPGNNRTTWPTPTQSPPTSTTPSGRLGSTGSGSTSPMRIIPTRPPPGAVAR